MEKTKQFLQLKQMDTFELLEQSNFADNGSLAEIINNFLFLFLPISYHLTLLS